MNTLPGSNSPLPLTVVTRGPRVLLYGANNDHIGEVFGESVRQAKADAEHLVKCALLHNELVTALETLMAAHAQEIGVPLAECVGGVFAPALVVLAKAKAP